MGSRVPASVPRGKWYGTEYEHIYATKKDNFIDREYPDYCGIKGNMTGVPVK